MELIVKPVRFGDCFILKEEDEGLLIDCGSANRGQSANTAAFAYAAIEEEIKSHSITDIMISHFDMDHYNGILMIPKSYKIKNTYIPYCIVKYRARLARDISFLLTIAPTRKWGFKLSDTIVNLLIHLVKISGCIKPVYRGCNIVFGSGKFPVLWPKTEAQYNEDLDGQLSLNLPAEDDYEAQFFSELSDYLPLDGGIDRVQSAYHEFYSTFLNFYNTLYEQGGEQNNILLRESAAAVEDTKTVLLRVHGEIFEKADETFLTWIKPKANKAYHSLIHTMNAMSIICHSEHQFLFLGDAPPEIIEYIKEDFSAAYNLVKIQHHGTPKYYSTETPQGKYWIISNGGFSNRPICDKYISTCKDQIVCTHGHTDPENYCLFAAKSGCSAKCICVNQSLSISF